MRHRWIKWSALGIVALLVAAIATLHLLSRDWAPPRPDSIPRGDSTYTRQLAAYRFEELVDRLHLPGCAAALIVDQDTVWQETAGFADIGEGRPVTESTVFKLWSLAKVFTAIETMRLVEEGLLDLDAPVADYVPGFEVPSRFGPGEPITIRSLLTHHSGLPRNTCVDESNWHLGRDGAQRYASSLARCRLAYPTGSQYKYGNAAYVLLGYLIQTQRGEIFPPYMQQGLFRPIGMNNAAFWSTDVESTSPVATGYRRRDGEPIALKQHDTARVPSGNLYGSLGDLIAFVRFVFRDGEVGGTQLIRPETLAAMREDHGGGPDDPQPIGLGWKLSHAIPGEQIMWHDGGPSEGTGVLVALLPERKLGVVFIANSTAFESSAVLPVATELLDVLLETEFGVRSEPRALPEARSVPASALRAHEGGYVAFGRVLDVRLADDDLEATIDGETFDLMTRSEDAFGVSHWIHRWGLSRLVDMPFDLDALEFAFQRGAEAAQDRLVIGLGGFAYEIAPRYPPLPGGASAWEEITGVYQRRSRLPDGALGEDERGTATIRWAGGRLFMDHSVGPVRPLPSGDLVILGGPFAGETILRDKSTGVLSHQGYVYVPIE